MTWWVIRYLNTALLGGGVLTTGRSRSITNTGTKQAKKNSI